MKKKTIIIIAISIIVLLIVIGLICFFVSRANNSESGDAGNSAQESKTIKIYNQLKESEKYQFTRKVNDENQVTIAKSGDRAYEEETFNGKKTYYVVNEGDLYLLNKSTERYYKYQNNDEILHEITDAFSRIEGMTYTEGKEDINEKSYKYEEFKGIQEFLIDSNLYTDNSDEAITRFYYSGDDLKYIKTIVGDKQELLKVNISYDVDNDLFNIPSNYEEK